LMAETAPKSQYRGSLKHKRHPAPGRKGTLCPDWTHAAAKTSLGKDMFAHPWEETVAHELFGKAEESADEPGRRFATARGMAFEAKPTEDGTWHGYPVPWEQVPEELTHKWRAAGEVSKRDLRRYLSKPKTDYKWPLESDED